MNYFKFVTCYFASMINVVKLDLDFSAGRLLSLCHNKLNNLSTKLADPM